MKMAATSARVVRDGNMKIKHIDVWLENGEVHQYKFAEPVEFERWEKMISG